MNKRRLIPAIALLAFAAFTSCKKNYVCTCTTVIGSVSTNQSHDIENEYPNDAKSSCNNYQTQANNTFPGGTTCHL